MTCGVMRMIIDNSFAEIVTVSLIIAVGRAHYRWGLRPSRYSIIMQSICRLQLESPEYGLANCLCNLSSSEIRFIGMI